MSIEALEHAREPKLWSKPRLHLYARSIFNIISAGTTSEAHWCYKVIEYGDTVTVYKRNEEIKARSQQLMTYGVSSETATQRAALERFCTDQTWLPADSNGFYRRLKRDGFFIENNMYGTINFVDFPKGWSMIPASEDPNNIQNALIVDRLGTARHQLLYADNQNNPLHRAIVF